MKDYLRNHDLHINKDLEVSLIQKFCSTTNEDRRKRVLSNWREGYIYCVTLGIIKNRREPLKKGSKEKKADWNSPNYLNHYYFIISKLLSKKEVLIELGLLSPSENKFEETKSLLIQNFIEKGIYEKEQFNIHVLNKVKDIADEFMNGGLYFLKEKMEEGINFTDDNDTLRSFLIV